MVHCTNVYHIAPDISYCMGLESKLGIEGVPSLNMPIDPILSIPTLYLHGTSMASDIEMANFNLEGQFFWEIF